MGLSKKLTLALLLGTILLNQAAPQEVGEPELNEDDELVDEVIEEDDVVLIEPEHPGVEVKKGLLKQKIQENEPVQQVKPPVVRPQAYEQAETLPQPRNPFTKQQQQGKEGEKPPHIGPPTPAMQAQQQRIQEQKEQQKQQQQQQQPQKQSPGQPQPTRVVQQARPAQQQQDQWWNEIKAEHLKTAQEYDDYFKENLPQKHIFVEFYAPFCHWCKEFVPEWNQLYDYFETEYGQDKVRILSLNGREVPQLMNRYRIGSYPFFLYFKPGGSELQVASYFNEEERNYETMRNWMELQVRQNSPDYKEVVINKEHSREALKKVESLADDQDIGELVESFGGLQQAIKSQAELLGDVKREVHALKAHIDRKQGGEKTGDRKYLGLFEQASYGYPGDVLFTAALPLLGAIVGALLTACVVLACMPDPHSQESARVRPKKPDEVLEEDCESGPKVHQKVEPSERGKLRHRQLQSQVQKNFKKPAYQEIGHTD